MVGVGPHRQPPGVAAAVRVPAQCDTAHVYIQCHIHLIAGLKLFDCAGTRSGAATPGGCHIRAYSHHTNSILSRSNRRGSAVLLTIRNKIQSFMVIE